MASRVASAGFARVVGNLSSRGQNSLQKIPFSQCKKHEIGEFEALSVRTPIPSCPTMASATKRAQSYLPCMNFVSHIPPETLRWSDRGFQTQALAEELQVDRLTDENTGIVVFSLNRPKTKNAIGKALLLQLDSALKSVRCDDSVRVVVLRSLVAGIFCAGADLKERRTMSAEEASKFVTSLRTTFHSLTTLPMPTLAAVEGKALGGGVEMALACDMRVGGEEAEFVFPETGLAIIPGAGGTQRLPRLVGVSRAKEIIFGGQPISADRAERIGLLNHVVPRGEAYDKALQMARSILGKGPLSLEQAKKAIDSGMEGCLDDGLVLEERSYSLLLHTNDRLEGLAAFQEQRTPIYSKT